MARKFVEREICHEMSSHGKFRLACWNCDGAYSSFGYLKKLLQMTVVLAVSEHWLHRDSLSFLEILWMEILSALHEAVC